MSPEFMGGGVTIEGDNGRSYLGMRERFVDSFDEVGDDSDGLTLTSTGSSLIFMLDFCLLFVRVTVCVFGST